MPQIHRLINATSPFAAFAISGNIDSSQLLQLMLVSNASSKIVQAEEAFSAITRQGTHLAHPLRLGLANEFAFNVNLEMPPSIPLQVMMPILQIYII